MRKRGQVTQFIIIGLILLFAVGLFILVQEIIKSPETTPKPPPSFEPLVAVIESCMSTNLEDALQIIGAQGGRINITPQMKLTGRYLSLYDEAGVGIPYWYYNGENHNPTLLSMESDIENYIETTMTPCIREFGNLSEEFNVKYAGELDADVTINAEDVSLELEYPLEASLKRTGEEWTLTKRFISLPVRLRKAYELALKILEKENQEMFLENTIFDLMVLSPDVPISNVKFSCRPFTANLANVRSKIKGLANYNFPDIRINNTADMEFAPSDKSYARNRLLWDIGPEAYTYDDLTVQFDYRTDWPMMIQATPSRGSVLRAEPMKIYDKIPTCYLQYHFVYDLNFPVKVSIFDPEGLKNRQYRFDFAFPVLLNHNRGDRVNAPIIADVDVPAFDSSFCDEYVKDSVTFIAKNRITNEDINHVDLWSTCGPYECYIGETVPTRTGYKLEANIPRCKFAKIHAEKLGYTSIESELDTTSTSEFEAQLLPKKKLLFEVVKHNVNNPDFAEYLDEDEYVTVTFKNHQYEYESLAAYPFGNESYLELLADWNFEYEIEAYLLKNDSVMGGYHFNWSVPWEDLFFAKSVTISVVYDPDVDESDEAQYNLFANLENISMEVPEPRLNRG